MFNDELSKQICKIGGPIILFICSPIVIYICINLVKKETATGQIVTPKSIVEMAIVILLFVVGGLFFTYKGYEDKFKK